MYGGGAWNWPLPASMDYIYTYIYIYIYCGACLRSLTSAAECVAPHLPAALSSISVSGTSLRVNHLGHVFGLAGILSHLHEHVINSFKATWDCMRRGELIQCEFLAASHTMRDVISFCVKIVKFRAGRGQKPLGNAAKVWLDNFNNSIRTWLAGCLDYFTLNEYTKHHNVDKQPPSRISGASRRVTVHPDAVWDMLQTSMSSSASLPAVIQVIHRMLPMYILGFGIGHS